MAGWRNDDPEDILSLIHIFVIVQDDKDLSKAVGRRGQNARLTARLMGWDVQVRVFDVQEAEKRQSQAAEMWIRDRSMPAEASNTGKAAGK